MKILSLFIKFFLYITTGILIVCTINYQISGNNLIPVETLWRILLSGFLTTVVTMLFFPKENKGKSTTFIQYFIHYGILCIVMMICGHWFGWMNFNLAGIIMMLVSVAIVYLLTFFSYYLLDLRQANEINQKLKEKYGHEE